MCTVGSCCSESYEYLTDFGRPEVILDLFEQYIHRAAVSPNATNTQMMIPTTAPVLSEEDGEEQQLVPCSMVTKLVPEEAGRIPFP